MTAPRPETPYHLLPLTEGTPLSLEKIKSAWPDLQFQDKVHLLTVLLGEPSSREDRGLLKWKRHRSCLISIALADANDYVRYFAALHVSSDNKDEESVAVRQQVVKDPSGLVNSTQDHWSVSAFIWPAKPGEGVDKFWCVSIPRRLAVAAHLIDSDLAECFSYAVKELLPAGKVTSGELEDIFFEFLGSCKSNPRKVVENLWDLVPELPRDLQFTLILINSLPPLCGEEVPQKLLDQFDDNQMHVLLDREDIQLLDLRRKVFRSASKQGLIHAAVSNATFSILDSDISELFADPASASDKAVALAQSAKGATLVQKQALRSFVKQHNLDGYWISNKSEGHLKLRSQGLTGKALENEVLQMRLFEYALALTMASHQGIQVVADSYRGDLGYLQKHLKDHIKLIAAGNPWETYLNLRSSIRDLNAIRTVLPQPDDEWLLERKNLPDDF
jgi:hypothetical protein